MKTIYFIRHAQTVSNVEGIRAGSELESPLTVEGEQQAHEAGKYLKDKAIQLIVVSPMGRTRQTAGIIAQEIGLDSSKMIEDELIIERAFGKYSGTHFMDFIRDIEAGQLDETGVEMPKALFDRVSKVFEWLASRPEDTILIVSHGATGRMFRLVNQKRPHDDFHLIKSFDNAEIDCYTI